MNERNIRKSRKKLLGGCLVIFALVAAIVYVTITQSGHWLVEDDAFEHVDWVVILDGQSADMERNDFVATLLSERKADSVLILGRRVYRDKSNADYYAEDFMTLGKFDPSTIFLARHDDPSTLSEACTIIPWLKKHKADSVLLVTTAPATRRAARIFRSLSGDKPTYITTDIKHHQYNADAWIFNRESRKNWLREMAAHLISYYDLWGTGEFTDKASTYFSSIRSLAEEQRDDSSIIDLQKMLEKVTPAQDSVKQPHTTTSPKDSIADKSIVKGDVKIPDSTQKSRN